MDNKILHTIRIFEGIKQQEAAALLDVAQQSYSRYESGREPIPFERQKAIKKAFNITDKELMLLNEFKASRNEGGISYE